MRLCHVYCLNTDSTLAKVKPDTNVKFGEAKKIREAFSKPYPKYLLIIYSLGIKEFRYMATDIYGAQWIRYAHLPSGFSCSSYDSLSPSWVSLGHLFDLWFREGLRVSDAEWMGHSTRLSAMRVNPGVTKSSCEIHPPPYIFQECLHPQLMRATFWLKQWVQQQIIVGKSLQKSGIGNYGLWAKSSHCLFWKWSCIEAQIFTKYWRQFPVLFIHFIYSSVYVLSTNS